MRICYTMTVFNGDYVLKQCLESIYEFASQILISEGAVEFYRNMGFDSSTDKTNEILHSFPDPENKIKIIHGHYREKDEQQNAVNPYIKDPDYLWFISCDEIFKKEEVETLLKEIERVKCTTVGFKPLCFYGGFDHCVGGYDEIFDQRRIFKAYKGTEWSTHRSLQVKHDPDIEEWEENHLGSKETAKFIRMYHYSYVFPRQMALKSIYYEKAKFIKPDWAIPDYFNDIYLKWVNGDEQARKIVEDKYEGVHPFLPHRRQPAYTYPFKGKHPESIQKALPKLKERFKEELYAN